LTVATVRHRPKVTKGPGSKAAGIAMAFTLIEASPEWRDLVVVRWPTIPSAGGPPR
jgi:hypothetical protein